MDDVRGPAELDPADVEVAARGLGAVGRTGGVDQVDLISDGAEEPGCAADAAQG